MRSIGRNLPLYAPFGIILSKVIYTFPQTMMIIMISFSFANNRLYEVADSMGTSDFRNFFTITLPSVKYGNNI